MARRTAFTLVELLLVVAILALLVGLLLPAIQTARESARRAECMNNQHQLALATLQFEAANRRFPGYNSLQATDATGVERPASWFFPLLPFLENQAVFDYHGKSGPDSARGQAPNLTVPGLFCPSDAWALEKGGDAKRTGTSYVANCGQVDVLANRQLPPDWRANGVFFHQFPFDAAGKPVRGETISLGYITGGDGTSNTLLYSENLDAGFWTDAGELDVGFVWEATLVDGRPAPRTIARINERGGSRWDPSLAMFGLPAGLACVTCGTGLPLPTTLPPLPPIEILIPRFPDDPSEEEQIETAVLSAHQKLALARPSSRHPGGVVVTYTDGHTQFLDEAVEYLTYCQLMAPNDGKATLSGTIDPVPAAYSQACSGR